MAISKIFSLLESFLLSLILLVYVFQHGSCQQSDTLTPNASLQDPNSIISQRNVFKFGFFTPGNSSNRYLGIFYAFSEETIVWVANRNKPLTDSSGTVTISRDGNLVLSSGRNEIVWSTNTTSSSPLNTTVQLLDTGNLVLRDPVSGLITWESFMHPTHAFLPTMKSTSDVGTTKKVIMSSWKTNADPAVGNFTLGVEFRKIPEVFTWNIDGQPHWRSGPWNGRILLGSLVDLRSPYPYTLQLDKDSSGNWYITLPPEDVLLKVILDPLGRVLGTLWDNRTKNWIAAVTVPEHECDVYGKCGPFGNCNRQNSPICSCLRGFEPFNYEEWEKGNWSQGCVRRTLLQCDRANTRDSSDGFLTMRYMKVPGFPEKFSSRYEDECRVRCLENCSCIAYAYEPNIGCMFWSESLIDVQQFPGLGLDLNIRLAGSELDHEKGVKLKIITFVIVGIFSALAILCITWCILTKQQGSKSKHEHALKRAHTSISDSTSIVLVDESENVNLRELPLFTFETLASATNQFHDHRLLGKGGFGPVYKGNLENGKEIAIKRLVASSSQGAKEFMNEVMVISKLQHRNLVRLIGCCVEREEKILVYEYMPNKSLDTCLFDSNQQFKHILDWKKRYDIIEGIGRGLLYLHKDSRLRIIHRDLKPSNVLLDENWSPKISDFGMAKIFGINQDHGHTSRLVGTYGYMAPEYATEGRFSEKSDIFSFGMIILEIISGKKNTKYINHGSPFSFLGWAWKMWSENNGSEFVDGALTESLEFQEEIMRCIHIALLCTQEFPEDRPDMQTIMSMHRYEIMDLAMPEEPLFAEKWNPNQIRSITPLNQTDHCSNEITLTSIDGR